MSHDPSPGRIARLLGARRPIGGALLGIAAAVGLGAVAFAYVGGWLSPGRLTPGKIVDALSSRGGDPVGHRRNHAKGICFTGEFRANGEGRSLSKAPMLAAGAYPVVGRLAIAVGNPGAADSAGRVRSMAVLITAGGQQWRSGMNSSPVFAVSTPEAFYAQALAAAIDPRTGRADPHAAERFAADHPESAAFNAWAKSAPWTATFADQTYSSLNAFRFVDSRGASQAVRWAMVPETSPLPVGLEAFKALGPDALETDLERRLASGDLRWRLVVTLAGPGDPTKDATRAWPADRRKVEVGTLVVQKAQAEADGPCRDINYDPTLLPEGIAVSDDPLLAARAAAYANSFDRREAEGRAYPRSAVR